MKNLIVLLLILTSAHGAFGKSGSSDNTSQDFSAQSSDLRPLSAQDMSYRLHIEGQVLLLNADGETLIQILKESRRWEFGGQVDKPLISNWRLENKGLPTISLRHQWTIENDGKFSVDIKQYDSMERVSGSSTEVKYGKLLKESKITVKDFAPVDWVVPYGKQKIIVRLTPGVWPNLEPIDIANLPLYGKGVTIFDEEGKVWADQVTGEHASTYFGVVTHQGSVFLSFSPFPGAKVIGEAKRGRIKVKSGKKKIILVSETPFLPMDVKAKVYGIVNLNKRTDRLNSTRTYSSDKPEQFAKEAQEN